jgi:hypothetical protein
MGELWLRFRPKPAATFALSPEQEAHPHERNLGPRKCVKLVR